MTYKWNNGFSAERGCIDPDEVVEQLQTAIEEIKKLPSSEDLDELISKNVVEALKSEFSLYLHVEPEGPGCISITLPGDDGPIARKEIELESLLAKGLTDHIDRHRMTSHDKELIGLAHGWADEFDRLAKKLRDC